MRFFSFLLAFAKKQTFEGQSNVSIRENYLEEAKQVRKKNFNQVVASVNTGSSHSDTVIGIIKYWPFDIIITQMIEINECFLL